MGKLFTSTLVSNCTLVSGKDSWLKHARTLAVV